MTIHAFGERLTDGERGETFLDAFFGLFYEVLKVGRDEQRSGIDRRFNTLWPEGDYIQDEPMQLVPIEYKTDFRTQDTGNVFIETVSVDTADKAGWAYSSQSAYLVYYIPALWRIYIVRMAKLRYACQTWEWRYSTAKAHNSNYDTHGLKVPVEEFERIVLKTIQL